MAYVKTSLDFYSIDTDRYQDRRIKRLKKAYKCQGIAVYDFLLCEVYRVCGYYALYDEDVKFDVADYFDLQEQEVQAIVEYCAEIGLFDSRMLAKGVITSASIQRRYLDICARAKRKGISISEDYKLIDDCSEESVQNSESFGIIRNYSEESPNYSEESPNYSEESAKNSENSTQSKVKERKVKENKENYLSLTPSCEVVSECGDAERKRFFEIFFFMNFQNPLSEVDRFINHYSANGWCRANSTTPVKDRMALARSWNQANKDAPPRFPPEFLAHWQEVYAEAKKRNARSAWSMIADLEAVEIMPQMIRLRSSRLLPSFIEQNLDFFKAQFFDKFYPNRKLHYLIKS